MTNISDRFAALSGLASRYQSSLAVRDTYLAGLWRSTLAHDLSWRVRNASRRSPLRPLPSWTWASLPLCTEIEYPTELSGATEFELLDADADSDIDDGITHGSTVTRLRVRACLRPFWPDEAQQAPWSSILVSNQTPTATTAPAFTFEAAPEWSVFSTDSRGLVVAYEARRQETVGRLDYSESSSRIRNGSLRIYALQLTETTMLLLEKVGDSFQRVGMAARYPAGFFEGVEASEIDLV
jgi:hypothetical protein